MGELSLSAVPQSELVCALEGNAHLDNVFQGVDGQAKVGLEDVIDVDVPLALLDERVACQLEDLAAAPEGLAWYVGNFVQQPPSARLETLTTHLA